MLFLLILQPAVVGDKLTPIHKLRKQANRILNQYCVDCHDGDVSKGDLNIDNLKVHQADQQSQKQWLKIREHIDRYMMPPNDKKQPSHIDRNIVVDWIERDIFKHDPKKPYPGEIKLRRLNREEYNNTIRDLLNNYLNPANHFPPDDSGYGFDNNADVLGISPTQFDYYMNAAEKVVSHSILGAEKIDKIDIKMEKFKIDKGNAYINEYGSLKLTTNGKISSEYNFRQSGKYRIEVLAAGEQAGKDVCQMSVSLNQNKHKTFEVSATKSAPGKYAINKYFSKGLKKIEISFDNDYYEPNHKDPTQRDRNLMIRRCRIIGPLPGSIPKTDSKKHPIFNLANPKAPIDQQAEEILRLFLAKAFRRPVLESEVQNYLNIYKLARKEGLKFRESIAWSIRAILVSPSFLYQSNPTRQKNKYGHIDDHTLASRLSYFLWSSMPDNELLALAQKGQLKEQLPQQIKRMLKSRKSHALIDNFFGQWLQLRDFDIVQVDTKKFPKFTGTRKNEMKEETKTFITHIIEEDRPILEIINADYSFLNENLADYYGIKNVSGKKMQKVKMDSKRGGLLGHASVLTTTSMPNRTSPVKRGKWVLENLLGLPPAPAPADAVVEFDFKEDNKKKTLKEQFEHHRADPKCTPCHARMDPIGFALENYDAIGRWQTKQNGEKINATGEWVDGSKFSGIKGLKRLIETKYKDFFYRQMTEAMLTYALGRGLEYYDRTSVMNIVDNLKNKDDKFSSLVTEIVMSIPFQKSNSQERH